MIRHHLLILHHGLGIEPRIEVHVHVRRIRRQPDLEARRPRRHVNPVGRRPRQQGAGRRRLQRNRPRLPGGQRHRRRSRRRGRTARDDRRQRTAHRRLGREQRQPDKVGARLQRRGRTRGNHNRFIAAVRRRGGIRHHPPAAQHRRAPAPQKQVQIRARRTRPQTNLEPRRPRRHLHAIDGRSAEQRRRIHRPHREVRRYPARQQRPRRPPGRRRRRRRARCPLLEVALQRRIRHRKPPVPVVGRLQITLGLSRRRLRPARQHPDNLPVPVENRRTGRSPLGYPSPPRNRVVHRLRAAPRENRLSLVAKRDPLVIPGRVMDAGHLRPHLRIRRRPARQRQPVRHRPGQPQQRIVARLERSAREIGRAQGRRHIPQVARRAVTNARLVEPEHLHAPRLGRGAHTMVRRQKVRDPATVPRIDERS